MSLSLSRSLSLPLLVHGCLHVFISHMLLEGTKGESLLLPLQLFLCQKKNILIPKKDIVSTIPSPVDIL